MRFGLLGLALLIGVVVGSVITSRVAAQATVQDYTYVVDSAGDTWLILRTAPDTFIRVGIPIYPATEAEIAAIPATGQWLVPGDGARISSERPAWSVSRGTGQVAAPAILPDIQSSISAAVVPANTPEPPTATPTLAATVDVPTATPTVAPTIEVPTATPTLAPTVEAPTATPTLAPTVEAATATPVPTATATAVPTQEQPTPTQVPPTATSTPAPATAVPTATSTPEAGSGGGSGVPQFPLATFTPLPAP